jgi:protein-disulfide isomerase
VSRFAPSLALLLTVLLAPLAASAEIASTEQALQEKFYGEAEAPVTVYEYFSLGCPHCKQFHENTLPQIKKDYVETGKVKFVLRDFPLGTPALAAAMIARCSGDRYKGMVDMFFNAQGQWAQSQQPLEELKRVARFAGMSGDDVDACLREKPILNGINEMAKNGQNEFGVNSTPSFVVDGKVHAGAMPYEEFKKILDAQLAAAGN